MGKLAQVQLELGIIAASLLNTTKQFIDLSPSNLLFLKKAQQIYNLHDLYFRPDNYLKKNVGKKKFYTYNNNSDNERVKRRVH